MRKNTAGAKHAVHDHVSTLDLTSARLATRQASEFEIIPDSQVEEKM
jgi:hypothetical protein